MSASLQFRPRGNSRQMSIHSSKHEAFSTQEDQTKSQDPKERYTSIARDKPKFIGNKPLELQDMGQ